MIVKDVICHFQKALLTANVYLRTENNNDFGMQYLKDSLPKFRLTTRDGTMSLKQLLNILARYKVNDEISFITGDVKIIAIVCDDAILKM